MGLLGMVAGSGPNLIEGGSLCLEVVVPWTEGGVMDGWRRGGPKSLRLSRLCLFWRKVHCLAGNKLKSRSENTLAFLRKHLPHPYLQHDNTQHSPFNCKPKGSACLIHRHREVSCPPGVICFSNQGLLFILYQADLWPQISGLDRWLCLPVPGIHQKDQSGQYHRQVLPYL